MIKNILFGLILTLSISQLKAQDSVRNSVDINEIEVWVKDVKLSPKSDTAIVQLYLQSYLKNPREFRLNTFSTGLMMGGERPMWYHSITMGNVAIKLSDRQNYLYYLLNREEVVMLEVKTPNWKKQWGKPRQIKLTFEDFKEEGKYLEYTIDL